MPLTRHASWRTAVSLAACLLLAPVSACSAADEPVTSTDTVSHATRSPDATGSPDTPKAPAPTRLTVPSLGIDTTLLRLGLNEDGTVEVPPAEKGMTAGWYAGGAVPGEPGAAVLIGHNDTRLGKAVFHDLHTIAEGADIVVTGGGGEETHFTVTGKESVSKKSFPSEKVYKATGGPVLRLVTCDGAFDAQGHPVDNLIVYANPS